jgi:hypothetical protein
VRDSVALLRASAVVIDPTIDFLRERRANLQ